MNLLPYGIKLRDHTPGNHKTVCPKCSSSRKHKNDPCLSVIIGPYQGTGGFIEAGSAVWNCHNCSYKGGTVKPKKEYTKPISELRNLSDRAIAWFKGRGISNQTLLRYKVTESVEWFPQTNTENRCINFNYFIGGDLVNIKFRDGAKNFKMVGGAMMALYGLDVAIDNSSDEIMITEGEIDTLSWYEAGVKIATSVPNGASKGKEAKLEWLEEMLPFLEGKKIYLSGDNDEVGIALRNEIARRLGKSNCWIINYPEGCKDANDVLVAFGPDYLKSCYDNAVPFPIDGIDSVSEKDLMDLYDNGTPEGYDTGLENIDEHIRFQNGRVILVTGVPGDGKTTFLKNIMTCLSMLHDIPWLIYSGEEASATIAITDMISIKTGKTFFNLPGQVRITKEELAGEMAFLNSHFHYMKLSETDGTVESIMDMARVMVAKQGIRGLVIDNMSTVERQINGVGESRHNQVGNMMRDLRAFAREHGLIIILVAHPKKMQKNSDGSYMVPTGYDVGDSSHYYNAPDLGVTVYRNRKTGLTEVHWWKVRFKFDGQEGVDYFKFSIPNSRYLPTENINDGSEKAFFKGQTIPRDTGKFIAAGQAENL